MYAGNGLIPTFLWSARRRALFVPVFHAGEQGADVFLETGRKDYHMSGPEERQRAVDLYSATPMTTAQVVRHLGYPTRQCLERWLAKDPGYAGHMAKPIILMETRAKAIELVLGGMRGSRPPNGSVRASERSATGSGRTARAAWPRCDPRTGTPARPTGQRCDGIDPPATPRPRAAGSRSRNWGTR